MRARPEKMGVCISIALLNTSNQVVLPAFKADGRYGTLWPTVVDNAAAWSQDPHCCLFHGMVEAGAMAPGGVLAGALAGLQIVLISAPSRMSGQ